MAAAAHSYRYAGASTIERDDTEVRCGLATSGGSTTAPEKAPADHPYFFQGGLAHPRTSALCLTVLAKVVSARFTLTQQERLAMRDPVVTSGGGYVRFEGFSGCCGLFGRVDLTPDAYQSVFLANGTTNVDFNSAMRNTLATITDRDQVGLSVGTDEVTLLRGTEQVVEKKVPLPNRWLKGFVEACAYQARFTPVFRVDRPRTMRFLAQLGKTGRGSKLTWLIQQGGVLRFTQTRSKQAVQIGNPERLQFLRELAPVAQGMVIYAEPGGEVSTWQIDCGAQHFWLTISPESYRGFSGEGQVLNDLLEDEVADLAAEIRDYLDWQAALDLGDLAQKHETDRVSLQTALSQLSTQGLVGYDLSLRGYFHRELPFSPERLRVLNPRLKNAHKLVEEGKVSWDADGAAWVVGSTATYRVELDEADRCTCRWYTKYLGKRGACKHILAAKLARQSSSDEAK